MGMDVELYFELLYGDAPSVPYMRGLSEVRLAHPEGATHQIYDGTRYYGIGYERGPWPQIAADLLTLMSAENVGRVWYLEDSSESGYMLPLTIEDFERINRHYIEHGERPYRDSEYRARMNAKK